MTIIGRIQKSAKQMIPLLASPTAASPPSAAAMSTTPLDAIFKEKRALRSRVRKELKSMDPALRSQEGNKLVRTKNQSVYSIWMIFALVFAVLEG